MKIKKLKNRRKKFLRKQSSRRNLNINQKEENEHEIFKLHNPMFLNMFFGNRPVTSPDVISKLNLK
jgi:chromatin remodeling complex protein RSC6